MMGVPGVATRIFATLKRNQINVVLISQASSEHSVTFCCIKDHAELAKRALEDEFRRELDTKRIESVDIRSPCSIIAAVGDGMALTSGVSGRFFSALGDAKINVHAIAQGSSERNISAVVWSHESTRALRAVHAAFSLSYSTVRVAILGMTAVGQSLLRLLETQRAVLRANFDIDVQVCVVLPSGSSEHMVCLQKDADASGVHTGTITMGAYSKLTRSLASETKDSSDSPHASFHDEVAAGIIAGGGVGQVADRLFLHDCTTHVVRSSNQRVVGAACLICGSQMSHKFEIHVFARCLIAPTTK
jgi:predicted amino acid-binding ACT domain protein